jgi:hypothetical protein
MNQETKEELKATVLKVRALLEEELKDDSTHRDRAWVLFQIERNEEQKKELYGRLASLLTEHHPEYAKHTLGYAGCLTRLDPASVVRRMSTQPFINLKQLPTSDELLAVVDEFEAFTDSDVVEIEYIAPLVNMLKGPETEVPLFRDAAIRPIGEYDKSRLESLVLRSPLAGSPLPN